MMRSQNAFLGGTSSAGLVLLTALAWGDPEEEPVDVPDNRTTRRRATQRGARPRSTERSVDSS